MFVRKAWDRVNDMSFVWNLSTTQ